MPHSQVQYRGERHSGSGGHNKLIELDSVEAQIIADDLEAGLTVRHATAHVNEHRAECDPPKIHVGMSAVSSAVLRMDPAVDPIETSGSWEQWHSALHSGPWFEGRMVGDRPVLNCWD